jgi:hypothetical protein
MNPVRWIIARYRVWRIVRWLRSPTLVLEGGGGHRDILPGNVIVSDMEVEGDRPLPKFIKNEKWWVLLAIGLLAFFSIRRERERVALRKQRAARRADLVFGLLEGLVSARTAREEIGDASELIHRWEGDPKCRHPSLKISIKTASVVALTFANTVRYFIRGK